MSAPAKIVIGGNIPAWLVEPLWAQIRCYTQFTREWAGVPFRPAAEGGLNVAVAENQERHLCLYDKEAVGGEFASLEGFLEKNGIHFDRIGEGRLVRFRGGEPVTSRVDSHGSVCVSGNKLATVTNLLTQADNEFQAGQLGNAIAMFRAATDGLQELAPPTVEPLGPFKVTQHLATLIGPAEVLFPGQDAEALDVICSTIVQHPITFERLLQTIQVAGRLASYGVPAYNLLVERLEATEKMASDYCAPVEDRPLAQKIDAMAAALMGQPTKSEPEPKPEPSNERSMMKPSMLHLVYSSNDGHQIHATFPDYPEVVLATEPYNEFDSQKWNEMVAVTFSQMAQAWNTVYGHRGEDGRLDTQEYRVAPGGDGPQAAEWKDKPHRLVYDLCSEIERLRSQALQVVIDVAGSDGIQGIYCPDTSIEVSICDRGLHNNGEDTPPVERLQVQPLAKVPTLLRKVLNEVAPANESKTVLKIDKITVTLPTETGEFTISGEIGAGMLGLRWNGDTPQVYSRPIDPDHIERDVKEAITDCYWLNDVFKNRASYLDDLVCAVRTVWCQSQRGGPIFRKNEG